MNLKQYLGDGVYVDFDADLGAFVLTTEDGISVTNRIVLEAEVWAALDDFVQWIIARLRPRLEEPSS